MPTLEWIGKEKVINHHQDVPFRVLERKYSYDENGQHDEDNGSENMIIRGDNLEALKALLPKYEGRVKCIYIDPPYNTGNEGWVYNDNVNDPKIKKWLGEVVGSEGEDLTRHDKWLCMMYPRLKLLHKLLSEDGAIFISVDDNEYANLRLICDEIFGIGNFLADAIWEKADSPKMDAKMFSLRFDHTLVFAKNIQKISIQRRKTGSIPEHYSKIDEQGRRYYLKPLRKMGKNDARSDRPNLYYGITAPDGTIVYPIRTDGSDGNWRWSKERLAANMHLLEWIHGKNGWSANSRIYADEDVTIPPETIFFNEDVGSSRTAVALIKKIFADEKNFETPKPIKLLEAIINIVDDPNMIVLDSFAGTGTSAHAVLNLNKDGGNRKFVLVEMMDYADGITAERVKRVINGYGEGKNAVKGTGGSFSFYDLGDTLLLPDGNLNEDVGEAKIRDYIWYTETKEPMPDVVSTDEPYCLGTSRDTAYYFYYKKDEITTLDYDFLSTVKTKAAGYIIYADLCTISDEELKKWNIIFKKIPRDIAKV